MVDGEVVCGGVELSTIVAGESKLLVAGWCVWVGG